MVAFAPHFVGSLLVLGSFALATNKQSGLLHVVRQDTGRLLCGRLLSAGFEVYRWLRVPHLMHLVQCSSRRSFCLYASGLS